MKTTWLTRALTFGLTVGILTAPTLATAATKTMTGPVSKTSETRDGVKGYATEYEEYTYSDVSQRVKDVGAYANLSDADYKAIADSLKNVNGLTDDQIRAKVEEVRIQRAREAAIAAWTRDYGATQLYNYGDVGREALRLAQALVSLGGYDGENIVFDGMVSVNSRTGDWGYTHSWLAGFTLDHNGWFAQAGSTINAQAFLQALDVVNANALAQGWSLSDPLVLDLNGNGKVDVTGVSSAKFRNKENMRFVAAGSVLFDLKGTGKAIRTEWIKGGDGLLVDNRKNMALNLVNKGKNLTIANLFGDDGGHFSGFIKLAREFDPNAKLASTGGAVSADLGLLKGKALDDMLVWIDDGDGKATAKELHTLSALGITEIKLPARFVQNEAGEYLERATFTRDGKELGVQEVWFATE